MESTQTNCNKVGKNKVVTPPVQMPKTSITTTYCPHTLQDYSYSTAMNERQYCYTSLVNIMPVPVPAVLPLLPAYVTPIFGSPVQPILSPSLPQMVIWEHLPNIVNYINGDYFTENFNRPVEVLCENTCQIDDIDLRIDTNCLKPDVGDKNDKSDENYIDLIESYLKLPKELFPTPNMLALDPNPVIDEFCKMSNLQDHIPWILDLEFGIPRSPVTRIIPSYNAKLNIIHCKNTSDVIHPGFESCDPGFKKILLLYYDCVVSEWHRGYKIFFSDTSIDNFQLWLLLPMQILGMCWS